MNNAIHPAGCERKRVLLELFKDRLYSITADNGGEFAYHEQRAYFPKKTYFKMVTDEEVYIPGNAEVIFKNWNFLRCTSELNPLIPCFFVFLNKTHIQHSSTTYKPAKLPALFHPVQHRPRPMFLPVLR